MNGIGQIALSGTLTGVCGTGLGGLLAAVTGGKRALSSVLEYAAGLMLAVVLTSLLPEAFALAPLWQVLAGVAGGVMFMTLCEEITARWQKARGPGRNQEMRRLGIVMFLGIALHNLPEGLAIGSGFGAGPALGWSLALTILIHDVPEGVAMAAPMRESGVSAKKAALLAAASGLPTGLGALIGGVIGQTAPQVISICLSLAAGAMLYVVLSDLIPQSKKLYQGRLPSLFNILGVLCGVVISVCI